jgi:hypothetical protein
MHQYAERLVRMLMGKLDQAAINAKSLAYRKHVPVLLF